jgi:hypothetical protein
MAYQGGHAVKAQTSRMKAWGHKVRAQSVHLHKRARSGGVEEIVRIRMLLIGTTNLDAQRAVIWEKGRGAPEWVACPQCPPSMQSYKQFRAKDLWCC